jgi:hypothetical protein
MRSGFMKNIFKVLAFNLWVFLLSASLTQNAEAVAGKEVAKRFSRIVYDHLSVNSLNSIHESAIKEFLGLLHNGVFIPGAQLSLTPMLPEYFESRTSKIGDMMLKNDDALTRIMINTGFINYLPKPFPNKSRMEIGREILDSTVKALEMIPPIQESQRAELFMDILTLLAKIPSHHISNAQLSAPLSKEELGAPVEGIYTPEELEIISNVDGIINSDDIVEELITPHARSLFESLKLTLKIIHRLVTNNLQKDYTIGMVMKDIELYSSGEFESRIMKDQIISFIRAIEESIMHTYSAALLTTDQFFVDSFTRSEIIPLASNILNALRIQTVTQTFILTGQTSTVNKARSLKDPSAGKAGGRKSF